MTRKSRLSTRREREALRAIRRACHAGLDSVALRAEVARSAARVVPSEACGLAATDPETGLFTHGWIEGLPERLIQEYRRAYYLDSVTEFLDLAASGETTTLQIHEPYRDHLRGFGLERAAHAAFCSDGEMWGTWCVYRERASRAFGDAELHFMRAIAPHVGYGLRCAALRQAALADDCAADAAGPGVIVLDARGRITLRTGPAARQLDDLADAGVASDVMPYAITSVVTRLRAVHAVAEHAVPATLRAQGRSGRTYTLHASLTEPDAAGDAAAVIVIEPSRAHETTSLFLRYGLTPREREVLGHVVRGESTKRIALLLRLSVHTVQDHIDNACGKVGVRGRKALLARILADRSAAESA